MSVYVDNRDKDPVQKREMEKAKEEERRKNMKAGSEPENRREDRESEKRY